MIPGGNVVPFERPAAYWANRARKYYTATHLPDAAKLMRKALEKGGDAGMMLELARIYLDMGCCTAAERWLTHAVARGGMTGGACFLTALCAFARDDERLAEQALDASVRIDPDGLFSARAQEILENHAWQDNLPERGGARSAVLCERAREAIIARQPEKAKRLAELAWKKRPSADAALLMSVLRQPADALPYLSAAAKKEPDNFRVQLLLARCLQQAGQSGSAWRQLWLAQFSCFTIDRAEAFCAVAWEVDMPDTALEMLNDQLSRTPAGTDYLRLKYLTLLRMGKAEDARRTLQTLLDIDPDDDAALWYLRHPQDARAPFDAAVPPLTALACQIAAMPRRLRPGRLNRLLHMMVVSWQAALTAGEIYALLPPLWRRLSDAERRRLDAREDVVLLTALSCDLLTRAGRVREAQALLARAPGKRRMKRTLAHFQRLMNKE